MDGVEHQAHADNEEHADYEAYDGSVHFRNLRPRTLRLCGARI